MSGILERGVLFHIEWQNEIGTMLPKNKAKSIRAKLYFPLLH